jgi:hypothetical protein
LLSSSSLIFRFLPSSDEGRRREAWTAETKTKLEAPTYQLKVCVYRTSPRSSPPTLLQDKDHSNHCMLGLRPKLNPRPSLLDLIAAHNAQGYQFPPKPHPLSPDDEVAFPFPLPASPSEDPPPSKLEAPSTPPITATTPSTATMAPSKKQQREDDDEQKGQVFSVSGPVIVAANMLGCAMYELVR